MTPDPTLTGLFPRRTLRVPSASALGATTTSGDAVAADRMQTLPAGEMADSRQVRRLERICAGIDERICTAIELGIKERLYFKRVLVPAIENDNGEVCLHSGCGGVWSRRRAVSGIRRPASWR
jgi:hypothetical protein